MTETEAKEFAEKVMGPGALVTYEKGWARMGYLEEGGAVTPLARAKTYKEACQQLLLYERVKHAAMAGVIFDGTCL